MIDITYTNLEEGISKLKKHVALRDSMGSAMWYGVVDEKCREMARDMRYEYPEAEQEISEVLKG